MRPAVISFRLSASAGESTLNSPPTVLIVDRYSESRNVLKMLLERRGTQAIEARGVFEAKAVAEVNPPDLIVVDSDNELRQGEAVDRCFDVAGHTDTPILVIGGARRYRSRLSDGHFLAKPYHYRDLLCRINRLLDRAA